MKNILLLFLSLSLIHSNVANSQSKKHRAFYIAPFPFQLGIEKGFEYKEKPLRFFLPITILNAVNSPSEVKNTYWIDFRMLDFHITPSLLYPIYIDKFLKGSVFSVGPSIDFALINYFYPKPEANSGFWGPEYLYYYYSVYKLKLYPGIIAKYDVPPIKMKKRYLRFYGMMNISYNNTFGTIGLSFH